MPKEIIYKTKNIFKENLSYKIVALFIALILWISILGRRDFMGTKEVQIEMVTKSHIAVSSSSSDKIRLKISGTQSIIKKFKEKIYTLELDATNYETGTYEFDITANQFDIPQGIKILSIKPNFIKVELVRK